MSLIQTDKRTNENLYSVVYFDSKGDVQHANFLEKNINRARKYARRCFRSKDIIAVGLSVGCFENKNGIYI